MEWKVSLIRDKKIYWGSNFNEPTNKKDESVLVFIHGIGSVGEHWLPVARYLYDKYNILIINRPGYGRVKGNSCEKIDESTSIINELLNSLGIYRAILIGHSFGGVLASLECSNHPDSYRGLVLVSSFVKFKIDDSSIEDIKSNTINYENMSLSFSKKTPKTIVDKFINDYRHIDKEAIISDYIQANNLDISNKIEKISKPTLIISPKEDKIVSPRQSKILKNKLINSKYVVIDNASHNVILEKPEYIAECIEEFINDRM